MGDWERNHPVNKGKEAGQRWVRREEGWGEKRLENITRTQEIRGRHTPAFPVGAASGQALCTSASGFTPSEAKGDLEHTAGAAFFFLDGALVKPHNHGSLYGLEHIHDGHRWNF